MRKNGKTNPAKQGKSGRKPPIDTRFKPGQSGNPTGRPKGVTLLTVVRKILADEEPGRTIEDVARGFIDKMIDGSFPHIKEFIDREEGKVPDRVANADGTNLDGPLDLSKLDESELLVLRALRLKAHADRRTPDDSSD